MNESMNESMDRATNESMNRVTSGSAIGTIPCR